MTAASNQAPAGQAIGGAHVVLEMRGITKRFGPLVANENVSLKLCKGDVIALLGETAPARRR